MEASGAGPSTRVETLGTVVVFLDFDGDHHEVQVDAHNEPGHLGVIRQAIHELERIAAKLEQFEALS